VAETKSSQIIHESDTVSFDPEKDQEVRLDDDAAESDHVAHVVELLDQRDRVPDNQIGLVFMALSRIGHYR
jgi:hypothetical protein